MPQMTCDNGAPKPVQTIRKGEAVQQQPRICVRVKRLPGNDDLPLPDYMSEHASGVDLVAAVDRPVSLRPMQRALIPTGIAVALPHGIEGQVRPRSGLALKHGITVLNTPGTIDADYRGQVGVILINFGSEEFVVRRGERIAQLVFVATVFGELDFVEELPGSRRGAGGFGSTG